MLVSINLKTEIVNDIKRALNKIFCFLIPTRKVLNIMELQRE
jgi:hypothetical protein